MKSAHRVLRVLGAVLLIGAVSLARAEAAPIVSIVPTSTPNVSIGDTVGVDINVSNLSNPIAGFGLDLSFLGAILSGQSFTNDPGGLLGIVDDTSCGFGFTGFDLGGNCTNSGPHDSPLDLFVSAQLGSPSAAEQGAQGTGFTLAHVTFLALPTVSARCASATWC